MWESAQRRAVDRGVWIGPPPFGYRATVAGHDRNGMPISGPLEPAPVTGPIVREAFRVAAGEGLHAAMAYLKQAAPEKRWRTDETRRLLHNRAYLGEVRSGELTNPAAHKPLTTIARFAAVQAGDEWSPGKRDSGSSRAGRRLGIRMWLRVFVHAGASCPGRVPRRTPVGRRYPLEKAGGHWVRGAAWRAWRGVEWHGRLGRVR